MSWKVYDFECGDCKGVFESLVQNDSTPEDCPLCLSTSSSFEKLPCSSALFTKIIPSYPGAKKRKAGYVHSHGNRPAEKGTSQISMHGARKR